LVEKEEGAGLEEKEKERKRERERERECPSYDSLGAKIPRDIAIRRNTGPDSSSKKNGARRNATCRSDDLAQVPRLRAL